MKFGLVVDHNIHTCYVYNFFVSLQLQPWGLWKTLKLYLENLI